IRDGKEGEMPAIEEKAPSFVAVSGSHTAQTYASPFLASQPHTAEYQASPYHASPSHTAEYHARPFHVLQSQVVRSHAAQSSTANRLELLTSPLKRLTLTALEAVQPRADERDPVGVYHWKG